MSVAVICGGAVGVWEQREEAVTMVRAAGLEVVAIAINDAGISHPDPLHHWVSLHPEKFQGWEKQRAEREFGGGYQKWSQTARPQHGTVAARLWRDGSSGLTAVDVALNGVGAACAILCGVPLDDSVNMFRGRPWGQSKRYRRGFQKAMPAFRDRVRSLAGWTQELLGSPDPEWLAYLAASACAPTDGGRHGEEGMQAGRASDPEEVADRR